MMGPYDPPFSFDQFVDTLIQFRERNKYLEQRVTELERRNESLMNQLIPGREQRELEAALDGEIRLLREQG